MRAVERGLGWLAGASLFGMMLLTFLDVLGRKVFDRSLPGSLELTELLMLAVIFAGLPLTSLRGEHVIFDLLDHWLPASLRAVQGLLSNLFCAAVMGAASWLVFVRAARTAEQGDTTAQLLLTLSPFFFAVAAMLALTALMHVYLAFAAPSPQEDDPTAGAV